MFSFKSVNDDYGCELLCHADIDPIEFYGKLITLFGKANYETENLENQFSYSILAESDDGKQVQLEVYCGSSGPAIGGMNDSLSQDAARELVSYISSAEPTDYDYTGFYLDFGLKINQGIRNGESYSNVQELDLSEEEFEELCKRLY